MVHYPASRRWLHPCQTSGANHSNPTQRSQPCLVHSIPPFFLSLIFTKQCFLFPFLTEYSLSQAWSSGWHICIHEHARCCKRRRIIHITDSINPVFDPFYWNCSIYLRLYWAAFSYNSRSRVSILRATRGRKINLAYIQHPGSDTSNVKRCMCYFSSPRYFAALQ